MSALAAEPLDRIQPRSMGEQSAAVGLAEVDFQQCFSFSRQPGVEVKKSGMEPPQRGYIGAPVAERR